MSLNVSNLMRKWSCKFCVVSLSCFRILEVGACRCRFALACGAEEEREEMLIQRADEIINVASGMSVAFISLPGNGPHNGLSVATSFNFIFDFFFFFFFFYFCGVHMALLNRLPSMNGFNFIFIGGWTLLLLPFKPKKLKNQYNYLISTLLIMCSSDYYY